MLTTSLIVASREEGWSLASRFDDEQINLWEVIPPPPPLPPPPASALKFALTPDVLAGVAAAAHAFAMARADGTAGVAGFVPPVPTALVSAIPATEAVVIKTVAAAIAPGLTNAVLPSPHPCTIHPRHRQ
jgi:hypothetical protein